MIVIIIGFKPRPQAIYVGDDGVAAERAAEQAQAGGYYKILKWVNPPNGAPLPIVPHPAKPVANRSAPSEAGSQAGSQPKAAVVDTEEQRKARFKTK